MARLFFALWPDGPAREALAAHGARLAGPARGRVVPAAKMHLTLVFLGEVAPERVALLHRAAGEVEARCFEVVLDEVGSFRHAGIAWAGCREPSPALLDLQVALAEKLRNRGLVLEARPFAPHLTLARRMAVPVAREAIAPVSWRASAIALVQSDRGRGSYATLAQWPLRETAG